MTERLVIFVPCLNEELNVLDTVKSIDRELPKLPLDSKIVLIDDGSTDGTPEQMRRAVEAYDCEVIRHERNRGIGSCLIDAYADVPDGTWVTIIPGDNEIDFRSIHAFVEVKDDYDLILGYLKNPVIRPARRRLASWAFTKTVSVLYGYDFRYLNGMKLFRVEVFKGIEVTTTGHAYNAELLAKAILRRPHLRVGEAPFAARGRSHGWSKAFRPSAIAKAITEVGTGWRSVVDYRDAAIRAPRDEES